MPKMGEVFEELFKAATPEETGLWQSRFQTALTPLAVAREGGVLLGFNPPPAADERPGLVADLWNAFHAPAGGYAVRISDPLTDGTVSYSYAGDGLHTRENKIFGLKAEIFDLEEAREEALFGLLEWRELQQAQSEWEERAARRAQQVMG